MSSQQQQQQQRARGGFARRFVRMCAPGGGDAYREAALKRHARRSGNAAALDRASEETKTKSAEAQTLQEVYASLGPARGVTTDAAAIARATAVMTFLHARRGDVEALDGIGAALGETATLLGARRRGPDARAALSELMELLLLRLTPRALMRGERITQVQLLKALDAQLSAPRAADGEQELRATAAAARALLALLGAFGQLREPAVVGGLLLLAAELARRGAALAPADGGVLASAAALCRALCAPGLSAAALRAADAALPALARATDGADAAGAAGAAGAAALLWSLSQLSEGPNERIQAVLDAQPRNGVVALATRLLSSADEDVAHAALRVVGNVVTGDDAQTQTVVDAGAVPLVRDAVVQRFAERIRKEALWLLSNVCAGSADQVAHVMAADVLPVLVEVLRSTDPEQPRSLKREAMWCISNVTSSGHPAALLAVLRGDGVPAMLEPVRAQLADDWRGEADAQLEAVALEGLDNLLKRLVLRPEAAGAEDGGAEEPEALRAELAEAVERCDGVAALQRLARGGGVAAQACGKAQRMLQELFEGESDEGWVDAGEVRASGFGRLGDPSAFKTLPDAVAFWTKLAEDQGEGETEDNEGQDGEAPGAPLDLTDCVPVHSERGVRLFLSKLRTAKEFEQSPALRRGLAVRVVEALRLLRDDPHARAEVLGRMCDSVDACGDKPVWALNQLSLVAAVAAASASGDAAALREVGLGVMRLGVVHEHAFKAMQTRGGHVDDVCIFLALEIALRERLQLPVSAQKMLFPAYARLSEAEVNAAADDALAISDADLDAWLRDWPEWQRMQRAACAESLSWKDLPELALSRASLRASLTNLVGDEVADPVRLLQRPEGKRGTDGAAKPPVWSLADLLMHWSSSGMDLHNVPRSEAYLRDNLRRCTRRSSLPHA